ncbi:MAG: C39 family peptidase [bacterium]|nr:C39 family peptidase [bacterium]
MKLPQPHLVKLLLVLLCALSLSGCDWIDNIREGFYKSEVQVSTPKRVIERSPVERTDSKNAPSDLPKSFNLDMKFFSQSPYGDWGLPYQEACEEASLILGYYYLTGKSPDIESYHQDLLKLIEWEEVYFGQYLHTSIAETAEMGAKYFGLTEYLIIDNPTVDQIKEAVVQGFPVLVPTSGRALGNPFFNGTEPFYHMLVVRGYDEEHFITNDVGTRRGENFVYPYDVLLNAIHDLVPEVFTNSEAIVKGEKRVLVIMPNDDDAADEPGTASAE